MASEMKDQKILDEAKDKLVHGKRFMAVEDYESATDFLEESCKLYDQFYGVGKRQCADAYLEYGLALVALANNEAGNELLVDQANNCEEENDDEEEEEEEEENEDEKEGVEKQEEKEKQEVEDKADEKGKEDVQMGEPQPGTSSGDQANDEENDNPTTIEIAWEVLCLAKRLYMTDESLEAQLKLADTLHNLGEISIEWDNNENAVSILQECLNIRTAILPEDDRLIASTHYHLGLAHSFKQNIQDANDSFQSAINVIEKRIASHTKFLDASRLTQDTVAIAAYEKEINMLKELLPEMAMRIDDTKDESNADEVFKRTREEMIEEDEKMKKVCLDKSKPVDDITHLVKRKTP